MDHEESGTPERDEGTTALSMSLTACEEDIRRGLSAGFDAAVLVGNALRQIRAGELYKQKGHKKFEHYCREEWDFTDERARQFMRMADTLRVLKEAPTDVGVLPQNEAQVRPLTSLSAEMQAKAWEVVVRRSEGRRITAPLVREVVEQIKSLPVLHLQHGPEEAPQGVKGGIIAEEHEPDESQEDEDETDDRQEGETGTTSEQPPAVAAPNPDAVMRELERLPDQERFRLCLHALGGKVASVVEALKNAGLHRLKRELPPLVAQDFPNETVRALLPEHYETLSRRARTRQKTIPEFLAEVVTRGLEREERRG
jgi:hypothetical protein